MVKRVPRRMLIHTFDYLEYEKEDRNHNAVYKEAVTVTNCRIDTSTVYARTTSEKKLLYDLLIFCYKGQTSPFVDFKEQSKVIVDGEEHLIKKVVPVYHPTKKELYSYELEVI